MELSAQAEANLGSRLSEVDDEIIVAYLEAFVADASRGDQRATLQAMAEAVASLGVPLRGDEPLLWVEQIHAHRNELAKNRTVPVAPRAAASATPTTPVTPPAPTKERNDIRDTDRPTAPPVSAATVTDAEDYWGWEPAVTLSDLFKDDTETGSARYDDPRNDVQHDDTQHHDTQRDGASEPANGRGRKSPAGNGKRGDRAAKTPDPKNTESQTSSTPEEASREGSSGRDAAERTQKNQRRAKDSNADAGTGGAESAVDSPNGSGGELLGELFKEMNLEGSEATQLWGDPLGDVTIEEERWTPSPIAPSGAGNAAGRRVERTTLDGDSDQVSAPTPAAPVATRRDSRPQPDHSSEPLIAATEPVTTRKPLLGPGAGRGAATTNTRSEQPDVGGTEPVTGPSTEPASAAPVTSIEAPFRPELFTSPAPGARRKRTRAVRVQAQAPEDGLPFVTDADTVLDDQMREALLAAASIPRPVFTRDLIAVAGDERIVDAWEAECRANVSTSPVRFVTPKSRHRQRGRLVAIDEGDPRPQDWWHQAVSRYRAGRLYELGVLLHRVGDEIVSFELGDQAALFRLNTPRGLVGVVVALDLAVGDSSGTRGELAEIIGRLLTERLTLLAVLTASGENGSLENLVSTLEELALENGWRPTSPIVAARSWEYADDRGSSAVMVLNQ